jgi:hypothetical protein
MAGNSEARPALVEQRRCFVPKGKAKAALRIGKAVAKVAISRTLETGRPTIDKDALIEDPTLERQGQQAKEGRPDGPDNRRPA